ncbi:glycosyltransferase family 4 protein [Blastococcus sp. SYSU D00922]
MSGMVKRVAGWRMPRWAGARRKISPTPRVLYCLSSPQSADRLYMGQFAYLRAAGFDVAVACPGGDVAESVGAREGAHMLEVNFERKISLLADIGAIARLWGHVRRERPAIIIYGTPKAALLGSLVATMNRVPIRIYVLHGLRLETLTGLARVIMSLIERMIGRLSTEIWPVSPSLRDVALRMGLYRATRTVLLGEGSCNGVDLARFDRAGDAVAKEALGLAADDFVFLFIGRRTKDKGVGELVAAFSSLEREGARAKLLMVGREDRTDPVSPAVAHQISTNPNIIDCGDVNNPENYFAAGDAFVLPTYREGLGMVLLEAAAAGCPIITTSATGARDVAAADRGLIVPVGDATSLASAMRTVMRDPAAAVSRRAAARKWVREHFSRETVWKLQEERLRTLIQERALTGKGVQ